ncbi:MAG: hypothetical protein RI897_3615 [Verrucomicrobiota bacterium]|jgi:anti-anti-sigma factor
MSGNPSKIMVAVVGKRAVICPHGRASFVCSPDFKRLVYELMDGGCREFVLELSKCTIMDSTFLGVLVWFAQRFQEKNKGQGGLVLLNASSKILDLITSLGMLDLFAVADGQVQGGETAKEFKLKPGEVTKVDLAELALSAHETLAAANAENGIRFKDVIDFLRADLTKLLAEGEDDGGGLERAK